MRDTKHRPGRWEIAFVVLVFVIGVTIRCRLALIHYLNPDEIETILDSLGSFRETLQKALSITHPPFLVVITYVVCKFSRAELAIRMVPVLAGSLFPLLIYFWLRRLAGSVAAMTALLLLTFSPYLVVLSAQLRPYTLALFFVAAALLVLDRAMESGRWQTMLLYNVMVWLCIISDYSTAWFVGAAGVFVLRRIRHLSNQGRDAWLVGQLGAVALYGLLYFLQVARYGGDNAVALDALDGWLRNEFPQANNMLLFPFTHTLGQFEYLLASPPLGWFAALLFAGSLFLLWTGRTPVERGKARALALLLVIPFALGIAGAYARQFPYGSTRHTVVFGIFIAAGIGILMGTLPRRVGISVVWGSLLLTPLWSRVDLREDIPPERHRKWQIVQALNYMRSTIPPGTLIFTERETLNVLAYYAGHDQPLPWPGARQYFSENDLAGTWRVAARDYFYGTRDDYSKALAAFRRQYGLKPDEPVWVLDGGWAAVSAPANPKLPFTEAVRIFQTGER